MIVDSSALIAVLSSEPGHEQLAERLAAEPGRMSLATWTEAGIVADARSASYGQRLDALIGELGLALVPIDAQQAGIAREAYRRYGRGSGSRARLNYGDCFAYALAVVTGQPLLYVGDDFAHTDVRSALA